MRGPSADRPLGPEGRQYHIDLEPGEVAAWIVLVGDPARARRFAKELDHVRIERAHREYVTFTGPHEGHEITIMATGMGADNTEIAVLELLECQRQPVFLRVGTCGALQSGIGLGDLIVSTGALRLENTSLGFVDQGYPAVAHHEVVLALVTAAKELGESIHLGITATAPGFYGWQGRRERVVEPRDPELPERLGRMGIVNMEMEASTLFTLASLAGVRAGAICTAFANRPDGTFIDPSRMQAAENRAFAVALRAIKRLVRMDSVSGGGPFHLGAGQEDSAPA